MLKYVVIITTKIVIIIKLLQTGDSLPDYTIVELGGTLDVESTRISDRMAIYRVDVNRRVESSDDYIAFQRPVQFAKCMVNPVSVHTLLTHCS